MQRASRLLGALALTLLPAPSAPAAEDFGCGPIHVTVFLLEQVDQGRDGLTLAVEEGLSSDDAATVVGVLDLIPAEMWPAVAERLEELARHESCAVREAVVEAARRHGPDDDVRRIKSLLAKGDRRCQADATRSGA